MRKKKKLQGKMWQHYREFGPDSQEATLCRTTFKAFKAA